MLEQLQALLAALVGLQAQIQDAQINLEAEKKASYDEGFAAGVASVSAPVEGEPTFSQAQVDAKIADAVAPLNEQITSLQAQIDELKASLADADAKSEAAVAEFKAGLLEKYRSLEVAIQSAETGFEAELM